MKELKVFSNPAFGEVRTITINNEPWFVGKDVATILGYKDTADALKKHVDEDDKRLVKVGEIPTLKVSNFGAQIINESGLYDLILSSKLPEAKKFKHWVTSEVIPSIRKHGAYMTEQTIQKALTSPDFLIQLATQLKEEQEKNKELAAATERMRPKEIFADAVSTSKSSILIGDLAKLICQNGVQIGQKRLFDWLRANGYLLSNGSSRNMPAQRYMEQGLFEVKESTIMNPDGSQRVTRTTKVTGKGQVYFVNKFLEA